MIKAGIDLGESAVRLVTEEDGLVFDEPCLVATDRKGNLLAIGTEAQQMQQLQDGGIRVRPCFSDQKIDYTLLDMLLEEIFLRCRLFRRFNKTVLILSYPGWMDDQSRNELKDHLLDLGAWRVYFDQEIWISAIGAGLDLLMPVHSCVANIGEGISDLAVFAHGQAICKTTKKGYGKTLRTCLSDWIKDNRNLYVNGNTLEKIIRKIGCVKKQEDPLMVQVSGIDASSGRTVATLLTENDVAEALNGLVQEIAGWMQTFVDRLPKEAREDVHARGIICCGGIFCLKGLVPRLQALLDCPVFVADEPDRTVCTGLSILISRLD